MLTGVAEVENACHQSLAGEHGSSVADFHSLSAIMQI